MNLSQGLVALVALQHLLFLVLEMFFWTAPIGLKVFRQTRERAEASRVLAANQGLYNGFLAAGLSWSLFQSNLEFSFQLKLFFLACVAVAGVFGALTVSPRIFWVQAFPALVAIALLFLRIS